MKSNFWNKLISQQKRYEDYKTVGVFIMVNLSILERFNDHFIYLNYGNKEISVRRKLQSNPIKARAYSTYST